MPPFLNSFFHFFPPKFLSLSSPNFKQPASSVSPFTNFFFTFPPSSDPPVGSFLPVLPFFYSSFNAKPPPLLFRDPPRSIPLAAAPLAMWYNVRPSPLFLPFPSLWLQAFVPLARVSALFLFDFFTRLRAESLHWEILLFDFE